MGKRKIVSVKLEQGCWEVSVKQSDPDQPGRFWAQLPNPSDVAVLLFEVRTSSLGKELTTSHLENYRTKKSYFKNGGLEPSLFWLKIFAEFDPKP